jgi:DNA-binding CsgD family transcriptional regulator/tetratricopeptide (TPR) repeat protein
MLRGRGQQCGALDGLLVDVRAGRSRVLVVRGEPGIGKTALLDYAIQSASGFRVARAAGVESEMELAFAALHQLCAPMLDRLERLPGPQHDAVGVAFGLTAGNAPDRFLVGLAVLSLLSEVGDERPLLCLVDDAQWLDRASAQALGFVARRLLADSVALVVGTREPIEELAGQPELLVEGLGNGDARALLGSALRVPLDERVRDRIVAETRGNPLALLELPRGLTPAQLAGGFGVPDLPGLPGRIEDRFRQRDAALPAASRRLLLVAAADPTGDPMLVWRAAARLGIGPEAATAAEADGLLAIGARVTFRHPLVRSAVYWAAPLAERRVVHRALAEATDLAADPDRRAWHRAQAAAGPDEQVAFELERSAGRAQARGGLAAAAAFLERSAALTLDPARRAERALAAARVKYQAGAFDAALALLATAEAGPLDEFQRAQADLLRGQITFASRRGSDAPPMLLKAARQFEPLDVRLARDTYLEALSAALFAGRLALGGGVLEVAQAARAASRSPQPARAPDLLLDGLAVLITDGYPAGVPLLKRAVSAFRGEDISMLEEVRWLWVACHAAIVVWDHETWHTLAARQIQLAREAGALAVLPMALTSLAAALLWPGDFAGAAALIAEAETLTEATGSQLPPYSALALAAWQGREAEVRVLIDVNVNGVVRRGEGMGLANMEWATAALYNGLGRYEDALAAAQQAAEHPQELWSTLVLPELIEAAARSGKTAGAADALQQLSETARASGTEWALGTEACSRALLTDGEAAESLYREAISRLGHSRLQVALARARLLYGEWLRRQGRRLDAREQLRSAHEVFTAFGMRGFAERTRVELNATGEHTRKRIAETHDDLTPQEAQISRLVANGATNAEIASRLFITPKTVEYHLHKVFRKLRVSSRTQLAQHMLKPGGRTKPAAQEH